MPMHTYDAANFAIDNEYNKFQIWGVYKNVLLHQF